MTPCSIEQVQGKGQQFSEYCQLRMQLWPQPGDECEREAATLLADSQNWSVFLARLPFGEAVGFLEVRLRSYAEGADSSPVPFIEGWFVLPEQRRCGIGKALVQAAEHWAVSQGYTEMASDTQIDNATSIGAHKSLGYEEVERRVCFLKQIAPLR